VVFDELVAFASCRSRRIVGCPASIIASSSMSSAGRSTSIGGTGSSIPSWIPAARPHCTRQPATKIRASHPAADPSAAPWRRLEAPAQKRSSAPFPQSPSRSRGALRPVSHLEHHPPLITSSAEPAEASGCASPPRTGSGRRVAASAIPLYPMSGSKDNSEALLRNGSSSLRERETSAGGFLLNPPRG
jgi:hypothetical protein